MALDDVMCNLLTLNDLIAGTSIKLVGKEGFEPSKAEPTDLQSAYFDRLYTYPKTFSTQTKTPGINRVSWK